MNLCWFDIIYHILLTAGLQYGIDYGGNNINNECDAIDTAYDCLECCQKTDGCKGFSSIPSAGGCWTKNKMEGRSEKENVISGFAGTLSSQTSSNIFKQCIFLINTLSKRLAKIFCRHSCIDFE